MKTKLSVFLLAVFCLLPFWGQAQGSDEVRAVLEEGLSTYLNNISPPKGCECNECDHTYAGTLKIDRHATVEGTLRIWGVAKVKWKSPFTAGTDVVPIYAEFKKQDGTVILSKLRWRKDACMKFETLMEL
jgi:hypothetical protein